jgi:hypothetical protein
MPKEMNIGALQLCSKVNCCCFTTESRCFTSILSYDGLINSNRSQDAITGDLHASYAIHKKAKENTFNKPITPHTEFQHFPVTLQKY